MASRTRIVRKVALHTLLVLGLASAGWAFREAPKAEFTSGTIDLGMVVSNVDRSAEFYKNAIGFTEVEGFDVPASFANEVGLSDNQPFHVRVLVLNEEKNATKLKLMQFADAPGKKVDNAFIHSSLGYRYLTIWTADADAAMNRLKENGVKPLAHGPAPLPKGFPEGVMLACVKDPDGNMVELVGPKK